MQIRLEVLYSAYASTPGFNENNSYVIRLGNGVDLAYAGAKKHHGNLLEETKTLVAIVGFFGDQKLLVQWAEHGQPTPLGEDQEFFDVEEHGGYNTAKKAYARNTAKVQILGEVSTRTVEVTFYQEYEARGAGYIPKAFGRSWNVRDTGQIALPRNLSELPAPNAEWRREEIGQ
jgi:hypothetical protein